VHNIVSNFEIEFKVSSLRMLCTRIIGRSECDNIYLQSNLNEWTYTQDRIESNTLRNLGAPRSAHERSTRERDQFRHQPYGDVQNE
jgi:hypothetical protein